MSAHRLELFAPSGIPLIEPDADLVAVLLAALRENGENLLPGDIVVIAQKIVSKAENQYVKLADIEPSPDARALAEKAEKDPRLVELVLRA